MVQASQPLLVINGLTAKAGELEILIAAGPEQWHLLQPNWPSDRDDSEPAHAAGETGA